MAFEVRPLDVQDADLRRWCVLYRDGCAAQSGSTMDAEMVAAMIRIQTPGVTRWAARRSGTLGGVAQIGPGDDGGMFVRLFVHSTHRRVGAGTALWRAARTHTEGIIRATTAAGAPGEPFAASIGARVVTRLVLLEQRLRTAAWPDRPLPPVYRIIHWRDGAPDDRVDSYAAARSHISDAPGVNVHGNAPWTVDRVRQWEKSTMDIGGTLWVAAAIGSDGAVAAFTEIETNRGTAASQHDTVVLPAHRGTGLAHAVKSALAGRLRSARPDVETVSTTVNAGNHAMLAVNRQLGYLVRGQRLMLESAHA